MEIHKPKPWRGRAEFLKEVGTIVLGVLIALGGEQAVEALHWSHKVAAAEAAMKKELAVNLSFAAEQQALKPCANRYIDILQQAVAKNRPDIVMALYRIGPPIDTHPWRLDTWSAALSGQVPDHLSPERVGDYSLAFRFVAAERDQQWQLIDLYGEAMSGRFGGLEDAAVANDQLKAADRLKVNEARQIDISEALLRTARANLGTTPSPDRAAEFRQKVQSCEASVNSITPP
jgi:hypothetical protein